MIGHYRCFLWAFQDGDRVIQRRDFQTERGARSWAHTITQSSKHQKARVTIRPIRHDGEPDDHVIAHYIQGIDTHNPTITHTQTEETDMGKPVITKTQTTPKTKTDPIIKRSKEAHTLETILAMNDNQIRNLPSEHRADIPNNWQTTEADNTKYGIHYARFLAGILKWAPVPKSHKLTADEARAIRQSVRASIGKTANIPVGNPNGNRISNNSTTTKTTTKPAATRKPAVKVKTKPKQTIDANPKTSKS